MMNTINNIPIFCLMGPTASGKTRIATRLVQHFPMEIISVDSSLVYRGMDIGTAKPDRAVLSSAPHRLINIREPEEPYSAAQFRDDAMVEIHDIIQHKKIPLLVGGTMLYFRALQQGLANLPVADPVTRKKIMDEAEKLGWEALHQRLARVDVDAAQRIHPHDRQRIQRALEVYELTGKNLTTWQKENNPVDIHHPIFNLALAPSDRALLHARIAERFDQMLQDGFVDEVKKLFSRGDLNLELPAIRSVGYRQVWEYLQGKLTFDEMRAKAIVATRQLAKRQLTWLRSWPDVVWFESEDQDVYEQIERFIEKCLAS